MNRKFSYSTTAVNISMLSVVTVSLLFLLFTGFHNCNTTTGANNNNRNLKYCSFFRIDVADAAATETTDLYKILGVKRSATVQEIKKAYRKKALDTHPDKNKNVPAEEATAAFHKVVNAFEILSDKASRNRYDRTGQQTQGGHNGHQQQGGGFQWTFKWNTHGGGHGSQRSRQQQHYQRQHYQRYQRPKLKDRQDVKESQARIMSIVSLEQLETIMTTTSATTTTSTDGTNANANANELVLERNLMICFYTPPLEKHLMDEMVYPWPFAGMSPQSIWWEDLLQTTVVRFHNSNDLTEFFGVPRGSSLKQPVFIFGRRGQKFHDRDAWNRLTTDNRSIFDNWAWKQLEVEITFVNNHDHPAELYWIHESKGYSKGKVEGNGGRLTLTTVLAHEWWVRDARTDTHRGHLTRNKLMDQTRLYHIKIVNDEVTEYVIPKRSCFDLSGHCSFWNKSGKECDKNPDFMHHICMLTCKKCEPDVDPTDDGNGNGNNNKDNNNGDKKSSSSSSDEL